MLPAMKISHSLALIAALFATSAVAGDSLPDYAYAPGVAGEAPQNYAAIQHVDGKVVGTIRGAAATLGVHGDMLEFAHGAVRINGTPVATVPKVCEIKYIVDGTRRTLYVNGKQRALPQIPPPPAVMHIGG